MKKDIWFVFVVSSILLSVLISSSTAFINVSWVPDLPAYGEVGHYMTFPEAFWWNFQHVFILVSVFSWFLLCIIQFAYYIVKATKDFIEQE